MDRVERPKWITYNIHTTIITTSANKLMLEYHERMPVIFAPKSKEEPEWLNLQKTKKEIKEILKPISDEELTIKEVEKENKT